MQYYASTFEQAIEQFGEVSFVLDSGEEYIVHGKEGYELNNIGGHQFARVEGMRDDEYVVAQFPLDAIEHHWTHKEV